jgi:hypothetical protein
MKLVAIALLAVVVLLAVGRLGPGRGRVRALLRRLRRLRAEQRIEQELARLAA